MPFDMDDSDSAPRVGTPTPTQLPSDQTVAGAPSQNGDTNAHTPPIDRQEAIQEGKQRAQAVVAASLENGSNHQSASPQPLDSPLVKQESSTAELQPARKRSRSGSLILHDATPAPARPESPLPTTEQLLLDQYYHRDQLGNTTFSNAIEKNQRTIAQMRQELELYRMLRTGPRGQMNPGILHGDGYAGFGNGWTARYPSRVLYPPQRKRPGLRKTGELRTLRKDRAMQAEQLEDLVPIRIDLEHDKIRLRDTFTWNVHDRLIPPEIFAQGLIEDFGVPAEAAGPLTQQVYQAIQEQIGDFHPHLYLQEEPLDPHLPYSAYKNDELRVLIKLNITIGQHTLVDQFDWDINNPDNSPEEFATHLASDMSLSGEFLTAIAHSIREQTQMFTKSLYIANHPFDGRPVEDPDVKENLLPSPIYSAFRAFQSAKDYTPYFYELNEADLERNELAFSREQRQQKRSVNRRGGPSLPDLKERLRTVRTMVVSSVIPGGAASIDHSGIYKPVRAASGRGRRPYRERGEDSDGSESEESELDSPARNLQGTARTRGIRGAASAAQAAMRANFARSLTPELSLHHHETRTLAKRVGQFESREREESVTEPTTMIIKLKIGREKYRQWSSRYKAVMQQRQLREQQLQQQANGQQRQQMPGQQPTSYPGNPYAPQQGGQPPYATPRGMRPPPPTSTPNQYQQQQQPPGPQPPQQRYMPTPQQQQQQQQQQRMFSQQQQFAPNQHMQQQQQNFLGPGGSGPGTPTPGMNEQRRSPYPSGQWQHGGGGSPH